MADGITDAQHVRIFDEMSLELERCLIEFNRKKNGVRSLEKLAEIHEAQHEVLKDIIFRQKRTIDFLLGRPYEPVTHFGESVLFGVGGLK